MEILKRLHEDAHRKWPELWPNNKILYHNSALAHNMLSVKQFLVQKSITEMEQPPFSADLVPIDFCFQK
jgi:hypothetical protein